MHQRDIERFAFLYLCGQRDRELLEGKKTMTYQDLDRLIYITDLLKLDHLNLEIWNRFSPQFKQQFEELEGQLQENIRDMEFREYEADAQIHDKWIEEFCASAPNDEIRDLLMRIFDILSED